MAKFVDRGYIECAFEVWLGEARRGAVGQGKVGCGGARLGKAG
jgi:hypothetical protein